MEDGNANAKRRKHYLRSGLSGTVMIGFEDGFDLFGVLSVSSSARLRIPNGVNLTAEVGNYKVRSTGTYPRYLKYGVP